MGRLTRKAHPWVDSRPSEDQAAFAARGRSDEGLALGLPSLSDSVSVAHLPASIALARRQTWPRNRWHTSEESQQPPVRTELPGDRWVVCTSPGPPAAVTSISGRVTALASRRMQGAPSGVQIPSMPMRTLASSPVNAGCGSLIRRDCDREPGRGHGAHWRVLGRCCSIWCSLPLVECRDAKEPRLPGVRQGSPGRASLRKGACAGGSGPVRSRRWLRRRRTRPLRAGGTANAIGRRGG